jgi:rubrerythrin
MAGWTLEDIPWQAFDPSRIDTKIVPVIKAASLVEYNAEDYRTYLCNVFHDDPRATKAIEGWAEEEIQHGKALGRWAEMADPTFDFADSFARFTAGYRIPVDAESSVRGSRAGELIARCIVETGTSSYYTALADATDEPVLKAICRHIAEDEFAHYHLFHTHLKRYLDRESLGRWRRFRVAMGRLQEADDDELAYAYHAANLGDRVYDRRFAAAAYSRTALGYYTPEVVDRAIEMVSRAIGLPGARSVTRVIGWLAWRILRFRMAIYGLTAKPPEHALQPAK